MKLKEIADMEDYLANRCYCPGEIYDFSGFFFQVFSAEDECTLFCECNRGAVHGSFVIATANKESKPQIVYIEITNTKVDSCVRLDATENNIEQIMKYSKGEINKISLDEYDETTTSQSLEDILQFADAIMVN